MNFKALFLDLDGTVLPYAKYDKKPQPSRNVSEAVREASKKIHVCFASGRSLYRMRDFFDILLVKGYAIAHDGGIIYELETRNILYDKPMLAEDALKVVNAVKHLQRVLLAYKDKNRPLTESYDPLNPPYNIFSEETLTQIEAQKIIEQFHPISTISAYIYPNYLDPKRFGVVVSHAQATKLHGVEEIFRILHLKREEVIGVGDSYNDFPLLMACGTKVAMGNAVQDLKEIADYVAPTVDEDGVVNVIERYIL